MSVKEVRPGETQADPSAAKKGSRDIGSVGLDELVSKVSQKLVEKVEKVETNKGSAVELKQGETPELKKQYFNKVGVEKNMDTTAAKALRGNMAQGPAGAD